MDSGTLPRRIIGKDLVISKMVNSKDMLISKDLEGILAACNIRMASDTAPASGIIHKGRGVL